jgi:hypothetical protein
LRAVHRKNGFRFHNVKTTQMGQQGARIKTARQKPGGEFVPIYFLKGRTGACCGSLDPAIPPEPLALRVNEPVQPA